MNYLSEPGPPKRRGSRWAALAMIVTGLATATVGINSSTSAADVPHSGCAAVSVGGNSGWCSLYPGNATSNTQEQGLVSVSSTGSSITVQTQSASTGVLTETSFACLTSMPASQITQRLQDARCAAAGGVWIPFFGGSVTIDLTPYPQFRNAQITVQVAANQSANNANGDAFYNNVSVSTVSTVIVLLS